MSEKVEVVIKIPKWKYKSICEGIEASIKCGVVGIDPDIHEAIYKGTPLPKGHGRLIDKDHMIARLEAASKFYGGENADAFDERFSYGLKEAAIKVAEEPTIIEADKEYEAEVITRGNCMMCGKELTEGLFLCKECGDKASKRK